MKANAFLQIGALCAIALFPIHEVKATPYTLDAANADVGSGNIKSAFYEVDFDSKKESGSAIDLYDFKFSGNELDGWAIQISWGTNPQPNLTSAFIKAANGFLFWDESDLASFNAGIFDSIILKQDGLGKTNRNGITHYYQISHAGINGTPGVTNVPDKGSTAMMLGAAFFVAEILRRRVTNPARAVTF